jgi:diguanylate cyclase (GGDEF)-like protein
VPLLVGLVALLLAGAGLGLAAVLPGTAAAEGLQGAAVGTLALAGVAALGAIGLARRQRAPDASTLLLHDSLTGLHTHAGLRERLEELLALSRRQGWQIGLLVLDLRHFREVNEAYGRAAGDLALRLVAARLRHCVRREDVVARIGADRFAVVQTALADPAGAVRLAERLAVALAEPLPLQDASPVVPPDIGVAFGPEDGHEAGTLLAHAEEALAAARAAPAPGIHCFSPAQQQALRQRRQLERDLREAVAEGAFLLHWQPQRRLSDNRLLGFEALLRWPHPTRGMVPPDEFIPLAEATGLIVPLGAWVLRSAAAEAARWPGGLKVAVNLSAAQVKAEGLLAGVAEALATTGLDPARLELELTESMLIQEGPCARRTLEGLRGLGVQLALDDFGTGWSSLAYLRRFPLDRIKMDRGFLRDLCSDVRVEAVVAAILGLGRGLGMTVVAEGIETDAQAERLRALGCELGQGWLLGRPMPVEQARALIAAEVTDTPVEAAERAARSAA